MTITAFGRESFSPNWTRSPFRSRSLRRERRVDTAEADLQAAKAEARGIEAEARSRRWKLQRAVEDLDNQIALLHARVAALDKSKADADAGTN